MKDYSKGIFYGRKWGRGKQIKERLVKEFGKCYWCEIPVVIYPFEEGITRPDNEATLDHFKSKNAVRKKHENTPKILACRACNHWRAVQEVKVKNENKV